MIKELRARRHAVQRASQPLPPSPVKPAPARVVVNPAVVAPPAYEAPAPPEGGKRAAVSGPCSVQ